jgi:hypothetical protein
LGCRLPPSSRAHASARACRTRLRLPLHGCHAKHERAWARRAFMLRSSAHRRSAHGTKSSRSTRRAGEPIRRAPAVPERTLLKSSIRAWLEAHGAQYQRANKPPPSGRGSRRRTRSAPRVRATHWHDGRAGPGTAAGIIMALGARWPAGEPSDAQPWQALVPDSQGPPRAGWHTTNAAWFQARLRAGVFCRRPSPYSRVAPRVTVTTSALRHMQLQCGLCPPARVHPQTMLPLAVPGRAP